jgi:hypothetical protein
MPSTVYSHLGTTDIILRLCSSSGILDNIKHDTSDIVTFSILRRGEGNTCSVGPLRKWDWGSLFLRDQRKQVFPSAYLRTGKFPASETLCFLIFRIPDERKSPETEEFWQSVKFKTATPDELQDWYWPVGTQQGEHWKTRCIAGAPDGIERHVQGTDTFQNVLLWRVCRRGMRDWVHKWSKEWIGAVMDLIAELCW